MLPEKVQVEIVISDADEQAGDEDDEDECRKKGAGRRIENCGGVGIRVHMLVRNFVMHKILQER